MTATTTYGVDLRVELGLGRQENVGAWDDGTFGSSVWGRTDTQFGDWIDVTCDVQDPFKLTAGANTTGSITTRWEAATLSMTVYGDDYNPWHGKWPGVAGPGVGVRVIWHPHDSGAMSVLPPEVPGITGWYYAFLGQVAASGWTWKPSTTVSETTIEATDMTSTLVAYDAIRQALPVGADETAAARVTRILDRASWPAGLRAITAGGVKTRPTLLEGPAWDQLLAVADTDLALLWIDRGGTLHYIPNGRVGEGTSLLAQLVACPDGTNIQFVDLGGVTFGKVKNLVNIAHAKDEGASTDPPVTTVADDRSAKRYGTLAFKATDLVYADTEEWWATVVANAVLASSAWPTAAPHEVTLDSRLGDARVPCALLALEPNHSFDVLDVAGKAWRSSTVGWDVEVGRTKISGTIVTEDISRWVAGKWDGGKWDEAHWGFNMV